MADRRGSRGFAVFIAVLVVLLIGAIALFVYASMHNGIPQPRLPGDHHVALGTCLHHG